MRNDNAVLESAMIETQGLGKQFGDFHAVSGVDLRIQRGHIHSVIGPNGAGKSTLFNLLGGALLPSRGSIRFSGHDVTGLSDTQRVHRGMARSFQITSLFGQLSVRENLRLAAQAVMRRDAACFWKRVERVEQASQRAQTLIERLNMQRYADVCAGTLAHGQQRMLEVGMCLAARPKLLLLDEPTSGMGVNDLPVMRDLIQEVARDHTILLIEHNMSIVLTISDRITVMAQGKVLTEGTPDHIQGHADVRRAYLGSGALS
ncbi:Lipopolysaccharide export system ATP-binding protein LptB [Bordetella tumbae]|uniref:ABC transporter ATP-binding protein n=1 Tax=Bordetella tumbae TaxID=1649139 RepID=UPI0039EFD72C